MKTDPITPEILAASVIAVPPLARNADGSLSQSENCKQIKHLEEGGVTTLLYGGNAILYHIAPSQYGELLQLIDDSVSEQTLAIPSVGPAYGTMMDQAALLRDTRFPTAMLLPTRDVTTPAGVAAAIRDFVDKAERPAVLYIKHDGFIDVPRVKKLSDDGMLSWIKYAVVREDTAEDAYLRELVEAIGPSRIVSGIGEQPAITHLRDFGLSSFTSGCVCLAPRLSMTLLAAIKSADYDKAEQIRRVFEPLEDLRNAINPVRVLHTAVTQAGLAQMGPILPLLCEVEQEQAEQISQAASQLLAQN